MTAYYAVIGWTEATPPTSARRGALHVRCAACLGGVDRPIVALPVDVASELAWHGARCARCHQRIVDRRLVDLVGGVR